MNQMRSMAAQKSLPAMEFRREIPRLGINVYRLSNPSQMNATLAKLRKMPEVLYAEPNQRIILLGTPPNDQYYSLMDTDPSHVLFPPDSWPYQWPLQFVQAEAAWSIWPGKFYTAATKPANAVRVAVIDTGVDITHPDFINAGGISTSTQFGGQLDLVNARSIVQGVVTTDPSDDYGHGTHVSGITAAATNNSTGIASLGYNAQILPMKISDPSGDGDDADVIDAMVYSADHGALIINMSLALNGGFSQALQDAVDYCWSKNTLVVAAAGNDATDTVRRFPGGCDKVLTVAATTFASGDTIPPYEANTSYSDFGLQIGIAAPGGDYSFWSGDPDIGFGFAEELYTQVWSTTPTYDTALTLGGITEYTYGYLNGTSMASPHVASLAALYAGYRGFTQSTPDAPRKIVRAIQRGADNIGGRTDGGWTSVVGFGRINAPATLQDILGDGRPDTTPGCIVGQVTYGGVATEGAAITATNLSTLHKYGASTKEGGVYRLANLPAGNYSVKASILGVTRSLPTVLVEPGCDSVATDFEMLGPTVTVNLTPHTAMVPLGGTQSFNASVLGASPNTVTWTVTSGPGTIDANGTYQAPASGAPPLTATIRATSVADPSVYDEAVVTIPAYASGLALTPNPVFGSTAVTGKVTLSGTPGSDTTVTLGSDNSAIAAVPASVIVPAGSRTATFSITTAAVTSLKTCNITAMTGGKSASSKLTIQPLFPSSVKVNPTSVSGGYPSTGTVTLNGTAATGGFVVMLSSGNTSLATVPLSVTVPAGSASADFPITTYPAATNSTVAITASANGMLQSANLTVQSSGPKLLTIRNNPVRAGNTATGTLTLNGNAPAGGLTVNLSSSNTAVATVPTTVVVPAGSATATFTITSKGVASNSSSLISATANSLTASCLFGVYPAQPMTLSINPKTVKGGKTPYPVATLTLNGIAPPGGLVVNLSSSDTTAATVPLTVTVPAGASTVTFTVTTLTVATNTNTTITASANGMSRGVVITVTP